jgi:hypothetical protein
VYDLDVIRRMSEQAGERARQYNKMPYHPENDEEIDLWHAFPFPQLGVYCPDGWEEDEETRWLCDSTGMGLPNEPAHTADQLKKAVKSYLKEHPHAGFAIVENGQFQVVVSAFNPVI